MKKTTTLYGMEDFTMRTDGKTITSTRKSESGLILQEIYFQLFSN